VVVAGINVLVDIAAIMVSVNPLLSKNASQMQQVALTLQEQTQTSAAPAVQALRNTFVRITSAR